MTQQTVELIDHYGTDLTPVNAARVSMNKESGWVEDNSYNDLDEAEAFAAKVGGSVDYDYVYSNDWMGGYPVVYMKESDKKLIKYLADHGHTSCFEHQSATLRLKVPIFVARQIHRHRTFAYNEVSRRYVKDELEFYWPDKWRKAADNVKQGSSDEVATIMYEDGIMSSDATLEYDVKFDVGLVIQWYKWMLEKGIAPEQARMILPQNLMTTFYMSGNLRNWAHFLKLRLDPHAQKEIRDVAEMARDVLTPLWPISMGALMNA